FIMHDGNLECQRNSSRRCVANQLQFRRREYSWSTPVAPAFKAPAFEIWLRADSLNRALKSRRISRITPPTPHTARSRRIYRNAFPIYESGAVSSRATAWRRRPNRRRQERKRL